MPQQSFFAELRKRKVVQSAAIYGAVAWGVTEVVVTIVEQMPFLPQWISTLAVIFFVVGFPVAMFLSWTFDLTAEGIQRTTISSRRGTASIALSMALLLAGTAGLFFLIKPALDSSASTIGSIALAPNSVAILPFDYEGSNPNDNYLGSGLSDELRDQLGRVDGLTIAAPSSSKVAAQEGNDARAIALKLGVAHLLEGNLRRQGNLLRISVYLIDGATGLAVWQETFDRGRRELLTVQQEIAESVANQLLPDSNPEIAAPITKNATAHDKMILARHYEQQVRERETVDPELLERAVLLYREATELDPDSALAHSRLAGALMYMGDIDGAEAAAFKGLVIDPNLAEVQHTLGKLLFALGRPNMGEPLARAVELNPNLPDALSDFAWWRWYNLGEQGVGKFYRRALALDPLNVSRYGALGLFLAVNDDYDGARTVIKQMEELFDSPEAYRAIARTYELVGDVDHAIAWTIKARDVEPDNPGHVEKLAEYFVDIGDFERAEALTPDLGVGLLYKMQRFAEMIDKAEELYFDYPGDIRLKIFLASAYSITGKHDQAVRLIKSTGIMDTLPNGNRGPDNWEAYNVLINAAYGAGEVDEARELIAWSLESIYHGDNANWWVSVNNACEAAIFGDDAKVRRRLNRALEGLELAWPPRLMDLACFKRFADDPAYLAVIDHFEGLRKKLRARLPSTLAQYGVSLD